MSSISLQKIINVSFLEFVSNCHEYFIFVSKIIKYRIEFLFIILQIE